MQHLHRMHVSISLDLKSWGGLAQVDLDAAEAWQGGNASQSGCVDVRHEDDNPRTQSGCRKPSQTSTRDNNTMINAHIRR